MNKPVKIIIVVFVALVIAGFALWDVPRNTVAMFLEKDTIERTARAYLNAEMQKDPGRIYAFLAPSSDYKRSHSYEEYLKDIAENPSLSINEYKIIRIYRLRDNDNRKNYPAVDKFVQVEVEVIFANTGPNSIYNYSFTFLKENGKWYKG
jgi:hypothetical protein